MRLHHIGIACDDIQKEQDQIEKIHNVVSISYIVCDENQNAYLCMVEIENGLNIELIAGKRVENFIKKRISYYHLCYEVDDINYEITRLQESGAFLVAEPQPAILFNNKKVAFLMVSYGLIELLEC